MLHFVHLIERRFPNQATRIVATLALLSVGALAAGTGLLLL